MTEVVNETYIPLKMVCSNEGNLFDYMSFVKGKRSLFEIAFFPENEQVQQVILLLCEDYRIINDYIESPIATSAKVPLCAGRTECANFLLSIYNNGIKLILGDVEPAKYVQVDEMFFGLNENGEIVEFTVLNLGNDSLDHLKKELSYR